MKIKFKVKFLSPGLTGNLGTIGKDIDIVTKRDSQNIPYIPASHFKGVLKGKFESFLNGLELNTNEILNKIFGEEGNNQGKIRVSNIVSREREVDITNSRHGIRIDRKTKTTEKNSLFHYEYIVPKTEFIGEINLQEESLSKEELNLLIGTLERVDFLGGLKSRGLGKVKVTIIEKEKNSENKKIGKVGEKEESYKYTLKLEESIILKGREQGNIFESRREIQGSTVRGAIIKILLENGGDLKELLDMKVSTPRGLNSSSEGYSSLFKTKYPVEKNGKKENIYVDKIFYKENKVQGVKLERGSTGTFKKVVNDISIEIDSKTKSAKSGKLFNSQVIHLDENDKELTGVITLKKELGEFLNGKEIYLGKKRNNGYGKAIIKLEKIQKEKEWDLKSRINNEKFRKENLITFMAVSDIVLPFNEIYDISEQFLQLLNINGEEIVSSKSNSYINLDILQGYNIINNMRKEDEIIIRKGSVLSYTGNGEKILTKLEEAEKNGVGLRTSEGFGEIEICSRKHIENGGK